MTAIERAEPVLEKHRDWVDAWRERARHDLRQQAPYPHSVREQEYRKWGARIVETWDALAALVEEAKARERILVIASDYLRQHWDMDSGPLNEIAEAATQSEEANDA